MMEARDRRKLSLFNVSGPGRPRSVSIADVIVRELRVIYDRSNESPSGRWANNGNKSTIFFYSMSQWSVPPRERFYPFITNGHSPGFIIGRDRDIL